MVGPMVFSSHPLLRLSGIHWTAAESKRMIVADCFSSLSRLVSQNQAHAIPNLEKRTPFCEFVFLNTHEWHRLPFFPGTTFFAAWRTNTARKRVFFQAAPRQFAAKVFHREGRGGRPIFAQIDKKERFWTEGRSFSRLFSPLGRKPETMGSGKAERQTRKSPPPHPFPPKKIVSLLVLVTVQLVFLMDKGRKCLVSETLLIAPIKVPSESSKAIPVLFLFSLFFA